MIITAQGAWWETLFGHRAEQEALAPVMPLLPTTIRSAPSSSATSRIASAGIALARVGPRAVDAGRARPLRRVVQRRVDVGARG